MKCCIKSNEAISKIRDPNFVLKIGQLTAPTITPEQ